MDITLYGGYLYNDYANYNQVTLKSGTFFQYGPAIAASVLVNDTQIYNSQGANALNFAGVTLENYGVMKGGRGDVSMFDGAGGGLGASLTGSASLVNEAGAKIYGGEGGAGDFSGISNGNGGAGGGGASLAGGSSTNFGAITGGAGGYTFAGGYPFARYASDGSGGAGGVGVVLAGGYFQNAQSGTVRGGEGGFVFNNHVQSGAGGAGITLTGGTLANAGKVYGGLGGGVGAGIGGAGGVGVSITGGAFTNLATGAIYGGAGGMGSATQAAGGAGVYLNGGTLTNAGEIVGENGVAVAFGAAASRLVIDPGATFTGSVAANASVDDVLALGGSSAATLTGLGTQFTGFSLLNVDAGANWTVDGGTASVYLTDLGSLTLGQGVTLQGNDQYNFAANVFGVGVTFTNHGTIEGAANPSTHATRQGVYVGTSARAYNTGLIEGGGGASYQFGAIGAFVQFGGYVSNSGTIRGGEGSTGGGRGAQLVESSLVNSGTIEGGVGGGFGVFLLQGTLTNSGSITGTGGADAVYARGGGSTLIVDPGAQFTGAITANSYYSSNVIEFGGTAAATFGTFGQSVTNIYSLDFLAGSIWTVESTVAAETRLAGGHITGATADDTLVLTGGGTVTTVPGGFGELEFVNGSFTVTPTLDVNLVSNQATILGVVGSGGANYAGGAGLTLSGGALDNQGAITGGSGSGTNTGQNGNYFDRQAGAGGAGVALGAASLTNNGSIAGGAGGNGGQYYSYTGMGGAGVTTSGGIILNDDTITGGDSGKYGNFSGGGGAGVLLTGGSLINHGTITGGRGAVSAYAISHGGAGVIIDGGTVTNAGTISGGYDYFGGGDAVQFGAQAGTLIVDPGAAFNGNVVANSAVNDVLELSGTTAATLSGLGTQFTGFSSLTFDVGASWTVQSTAATINGMTIIGAAATDTLSLTGGGQLSGDFGALGLLISNSGELTLQAGVTGIGAVHLETGSLYLGGDNVVEGAIALDPGTTLGFSDDDLTIANTISVFSNTTFDAEVGQSETISGDITDHSPGVPGSPGVIYKTGDGTLTLTGNNSYSGGTFIVGGTFEFAAGSAGTGAISFGFGAATLKIDGTTMPTNQIDQFAADDAIDLANIGYIDGAHADMDYATNVLTVAVGGHSYQIDFDPTQTFAGDFFHLSANGGGTQIVENTTPCYCPGSLILTDRGERTVETLQIGDLIVTAAGERRPIKWIGARAYSARFARNNADAHPVGFMAGSLGDNLPHSDLWVSPDHAMYLDGVLIPARHLVNHETIVQPLPTSEVRYIHVEVESHDLLIANGAVSESFLDDGSRGLFHNAASYATLYPAEADSPRVYCAPRVEDGHALARVQERLAVRAAAVTMSVLMTRSYQGAGASASGSGTRPIGSAVSDFNSCNSK